MKRFTWVLLFFTATHLAAGELVTNVGARKSTPLDGSWQAIVDPFDNGYYSYRYTPRADGYFKNRKPEDKSALVEYDFDASEPLHVPGDWNSQRPELYLYEGTVWYKRDFDYELPPARRLFVHFGAANYEAKVYLNGELVGEHRGGFTPFQFEVTDRIRPEGNFLVVQVDNRRHREGVPTVNTDWWNYGGLTRRVLLVEVPETFVRDYFLQLDPRSPGEIAGWVELDGPAPSQEVRIHVAGTEHRAKTDEKGRATVRFAARPKLWSPEDPVLQEVEIAAESDTVKERIGFRTIERRGDEILLNGESVFLRGISIHEEAPLRGGRAVGREDARILLGWAKELGCNFVRLAHYPHNEAMVRTAEEMGLMVWSEIPVYWTILWENDETYRLAEQQLVEMIQRDKNRASVVLWSVANETPRSEARLVFLTRLIERARSIDPTRLLTAATELTYTHDGLLLDDPLGEHLDVIGANEYLGWYGGRPEDIPKARWTSTHGKPLVISEFGAGALYGYHADAETRWSEEYQRNVYEKQIEMLRKIDFLRGLSPWILMDFRSPRRPLPKIQDFWNRKGLVSNHGLKKEAFAVLQGFYQELAEASETRQ